MVHGLLGRIMHRLENNIKKELKMWLMSNIWEQGQNAIHGKIKSGLDSGSACYHSLQKLLSYQLLSKSLKIKI
jgi:hypothetical protein